MSFVIRSQGFFYTDEYYAPAGAWARVFKESYETAEEAERERRALDRARLRGERPTDYVFDAPEKIEQIIAYLRGTFPASLGELTDNDFYQWHEWPEELEDKHFDALLGIIGIEFNIVVEWEESEQNTDDDANMNDGMLDELWFGADPHDEEDEL